MMPRSTILAVLVLAAVLPCAAYEVNLQDGYGETKLGDPINASGTRRTESSPPVELRVNLLQVDDTNLDGAADASSVLAEADRSRFARLVESAASYWEAVPSSSIAVRLTSSDSSSTYVNLRAFILMTLGRIPSGTAGASWSRAVNGQHFPLGVIISLDYFRAVSDAVILSTIVHEIGHALGLSHSSCDRYLTYNARFANTDSDGAFLSYGDRDGRAVLHTDDVAGIAHCYPVASMAGQFGSIEGELVDASGNPIFGGNVFAVSDANRAVVSRISGLANFRSLSARGGFFRLDGLAPGTYTLVAASVTDATYRIGSLPRLPFDSYYNRSFAAAIRTGVVVQGGGTAALGRVAAGSTAAAPPPATSISWNAVAGASSYAVYLFSYGENRWIVNGQQTVANSLAISLAQGRYSLEVQALVAGVWQLAERRIVRQGDRPPVVSAPASASGTAGQALTILFGASDPLGGPVTLGATGMPAGMVLSSDRFSWANPTAGSWSLVLTATNEVGQSTSSTIALAVRAVSGGNLNVSWSRLAYDQNYYVQVYNRTTRRWVVLVYTNANSASIRLGAGSYTVYVDRRIYYRNRYSWSRVGSANFSISSSDVAVRLP